MSTHLTSINSMSLESVRSMAEMAVKANLFTDIKTVDSMTTLMMLCVAENIHPMHAVRRYHIINGKPSMKADAMLGEFQSRGGRVEWICCTHEKVEAIFDAPGLTNPTPPVCWTIADAERAGIMGNPTWKKYPRQMLKARVISEGIRMSMPEIISGIYTPEEVEDFKPSPNYQEKEVKPEKQPKPQVIEHIEPLFVTPEMVQQALEEIKLATSLEDLRNIAAVTKDWPELLKQQLRDEFEHKKALLKESL